MSSVKVLFGDENGDMLEADLEVLAPASNDDQLSIQIYGETHQYAIVLETIQAAELAIELFNALGVKVQVVR